MPLPPTGLLSPPFVPSGSPGGPGASSSGGLLLGPALTGVEGVCIAFGSDPLDTTPQWTRLDDPNGPFKVVGWDIQRGRSYELDRSDTGRATIRLMDTTGDFDPTNTASFFYNQLDPLKQAAIALRNPVSDTWFTLFTGFVDDIICDVDVTERFLTVEFRLVDGFDLLAAAELYPGVAGHTVPASSTGNLYFNTQTVEQRMQKVLDDAGWPNAWRDVFSGNVNVQQTVYPPRTNALTVLQDTADAEFPGVANCYMAKDGDFTFHGRYARFRPAVVQYGIDTWKVGDKAAMLASPTDTAVISSMTFGRGKTNLINAALATPQNIADADIAGQMSRDTASIATYNTRSTSFENLLTYTSLEDASTPLQETKKFSNYYKNNFASPRNRISTLRFRSIHPSSTGGSAMWQFLCNVEISDKVSVTTDHPGSGGFSATEFYVEGIRYQAFPHPDHPLIDMELDVSPTGYYTTEPAT